MPKQEVIGAALIRNKNKRKGPKSKLHTTEEGPKLKSIIDQNNLDEFMTLASLANRQFTAERTFKIVSESRIVGKSELHAKSINGQNYRALRLPRRPKWTQETTPEQLNELENLAFLQWRKELAETEESEINSSVTPYEKNLDIWRQLWRVLERSEVICQIVDARNPLFFRNPDLENYIKELSPEKSFVLILNKADLVPENIRNLWAEYFEREGVDIMYFSAYKEQELIDNDMRRWNQFGEKFENRDKSYIYSSQELLDRLSNPSKHVNIGFVGYPNVGKSSVINVLMGEKRVGVAAQPGKTKHLQTLNLSPNITLCDCPGLVFPSLLSSRAEMVTCGVLPIDQLKDILSPVEIICLRVHSSLLENLYGIQLGGRVPGTILLQKIANHRSFTIGSGLPDESKAGKIVLKDYVNGKLLYCHLPPGFETELEPEAVEEKKEIVDPIFFSKEVETKLGVDKEGGIFIEAGHKLTKKERRELKFAVKRGENFNEKLQEITKPKESNGVIIKNRNIS
ncbi:unnamed protein product [Blepharisma stoltei]|uniref:CP-type G domain-containing protein n=1 Tax=Blepharisma stoltei TaxID=1481888 RepID=A0AAU9IRX7_9CILI|nr:unnamed protein product [Blepharisma stoltei]